MYQLLTSLYVLYGRPFKQRSPLRVSEELVPREYSEQHSFLIALRDKMFAHVDTDGLSEHNINNLNKILLQVQNGVAVAATASLLPTGFQFDPIRDLCGYLHDTCDKKSQEILIDAMNGSCPADLTYEIDLRPEDAYLIKLVQWRP